jgi:hypothetical protein
MPSLNKCPNCNSCLDNVMIEPRRFFHCWLENTFYDKIAGKLILVDVYTLMSVDKDKIDALLYKKNPSRFT